MPGTAFPESPQRCLVDGCGATDGNHNVEAHFVYDERTARVKAQLAALEKEAAAQDRPCPLLGCRYPLEDHDRGAHIHAENKRVLDEELKLGLRRSPEEAARLSKPSVVSAGDVDEAGLLTPNEHELVAMLGRCFTAFSVIVGHDATREADLREATAHIHALQNMVLAQAAARAYPGRYRLAGAWAQ